MIVSSDPNGRREAFPNIYTNSYLRDVKMRSGNDEWQLAMGPSSLFLSVPRSFITHWVTPTSSTLLQTVGENASMDARLEVGMVTRQWW